MAAVAGLVNLGNTCYINACLQALASVTTLHQQLRTALQEGCRVLGGAADGIAHRPKQALVSRASCSVGRDSGLAALLSFLERLQPSFASRLPSLSASSLLQALSCDLCWEGGTEEDAAEALGSILDHIDGSLKTAGRIEAKRGDAGLKHLLQGQECLGGSDAESSSPPNRVATNQSSVSAALLDWGQRFRPCFQGTLVRCSRCLKCGAQLDSQHEPFAILSLALPPPLPTPVPGVVRIPPGTSLASLLRSLTAYEMVEGYRCSRCATRRAQDREQGSRVARWARFGLLPKVLFIHLQSSAWAAGHAVKSVGRVSFPLTLSPADLGPQWGQETSFPDHPPYVLRAVLCHSGLAQHTGHYTVLRRLGEQEAAWVAASDQDVRPCPLDKVLESQAVLLTYEAR